MTEGEWLSCTTRPADMLRFAVRKVPRRKLVLLGCACGRQVWDHLDAAGRQAIEAAEADADPPPDETWDIVCVLPSRTATDPFEETAGAGAADAARNAVLAATHPNLWAGLDRAFGWVQTVAARTAAGGAVKAALDAGRGRTCDLIREVIGNPFREWKVQAAHLGGGLVQPDGRFVPFSETVRTLAAAIDAERAYDRLPILADAAEEAGVTDPAMLDHLRHGTTHTRGCWALDLLRGKG